VGDAALLVLEAAAADLDGAEDGLEGVRGAAASADLLAALTGCVAEEQLLVGVLKGLPEEQALEALAGVLDGAFQGGGEVFVLGGQGQVQFQLGAQVDAAALGLDLVQADGRLGLRGGAHGGSLVAEGTCHAHLPIPTHLQPPPPSYPGAHSLVPGRNLFPAWNFC
jgi:hypothetical protein